MKFSIETIRGLLASKDSELMKVGLEMVAVHGLRELGNEVADLITHKEAAIRDAAVETLINIQDGSLSKKIADIVCNENVDPSARQSAIKVLVWTGSISIVKDKIRDLIHHGPAGLRVAAIQATREIGKEEFYEDLLAIMCVGDLNICEAAARAIADIKRDQKQELFELFSLLLDEEDEAQRYGAIIGCGKIADRRAGAKLISMLRQYREAKKSERRDLLIGALAETLGMIGSLEALPELADLLTHENDEVRIKAAFALGRMGHPDAEQPLKEALRREEDKAIRSHIVNSLSMISAAKSRKGVAGTFDIKDIETMVIAGQEEERGLKKEEPAVKDAEGEIERRQSYEDISKEPVGITDAAAAHWKTPVLFTNAMKWVLVSAISLAVLAAGGSAIFFLLTRSGARERISLPGIGENEGAVILKVIPSDANVKIGGKRVPPDRLGKQVVVPARVPVEVELWREGFMKEVFSIVVPPRTIVMKEIMLENLKGRVMVGSVPDRAEVYVGEQLRGETPVVIYEFPIGESTTVTVRKEGYMALSEEVELSEEKTERTIFAFLEESKEEGEVDDSGRARVGAGKRSRNLFRELSREIKQQVKEIKTKKKE